MQRYGWGGTMGGAPGSTNTYNYTFANNRETDFQYDAAGNLTSDIGQNFIYDAAGNQTQASYSGYTLTQSYDGDGRRVMKSDKGAITYYVRSSLMGGEVVSELSGTAGTWSRGYVYNGGSLLAVQQGGVYWVHQNPVTKNQRMTDVNGALVNSIVDLDPWGGETSQASNGEWQPKEYTSYIRDGNASDDAQMRRYNRWHARFDQPDPYAGSYDQANPQSFNRYAYTGNDPVNFTDPSGLDPLTFSRGGWDHTWDDGWNNPPIRGITFLPGHGVFGLAGGGAGATTNSYRFRVDVIEGHSGDGEPDQETDQDQERQRQQRGFDDCAKSAIHNFRRSEYAAIGKIAAGTVLTYLAGKVSAKAAQANADAVAGVRSVGGRILGYTARYQLGQALANGSALLTTPPLALLLNGFNDSRNNNAQLDQALAACKSQFPQADPSTTKIFITTW